MAPRNSIIWIISGFNFVWKVAKIKYTRCLCGQTRVPFYFSDRNGPRTPSYLPTQVTSDHPMLSLTLPPLSQTKVSTALSPPFCRSKSNLSTARVVTDNDRRYQLGDEKRVVQTQRWRCYATSLLFGQAGNLMWGRVRSTLFSVQKVCVCYFRPTLEPEIRTGKCCRVCCCHQVVGSR